MAAFPLGTVLLPGQLMTLRVFEPRYRVMLFDLRNDEPAEFIVTMIERGSEVGGGDVRSAFGCVARVADTQDAEDGSTILTVVGTDRARVRTWLPEDPYPMADVERLTDGPPGADQQLGVGREWPSDTLIPALVTTAERVRELAEALGQPPQRQRPDFAGDPTTVVWQIALGVPLATIDRYKLLATGDPTRRAELLGEQLRELDEILTGRLALGPPETDR